MFFKNDQWIGLALMALTAGLGFATALVRWQEAETGLEQTRVEAARDGDVARCLKEMVEHQEAQRTERAKEMFRALRDPSTGPTVRSFMMKHDADWRGLL